MCIWVGKNTFCVEKTAQFWIMVKQQKSEKMKRLTILATVPAQTNHISTLHISCCKYILQCNIIIQNCTPAIEERYWHKNKSKISDPRGKDITDFNIYHLLSLFTYVTWHHFCQSNLGYSSWPLEDFTSQWESNWGQRSKSPPSQPQPFLNYITLYPVEMQQTVECIWWWWHRSSCTARLWSIWERRGYAGCASIRHRGHNRCCVTCSRASMQTPSCCWPMLCLRPTCHACLRATLWHTTSE